MLRSLREWLSRLPEGVATCEESKAPHEYVVRVVPRNGRAASVTFRFSEYGTFGLYIGTAIRIEDLPLSSDHVLEICDAVCDGRVQEEMWMRRGKRLKSVGVLQLLSGDLHGTDYQGALGAFCADQHLVQKFEPYS